MPPYVAGGRRVDDHEVVGGVLATAVAARQVPEAVDRADLAQARGGGHRQVEQAVLEDDPVDGTADLPAEEVVCGRDRVDRQQRDAGLDDRLVVADRRVAEERREPLAGDLGDQDALAAAGGEDAERRRDGGLARPSLAGDEEEAAIQEGHLRPPYGADVCAALGGDERASRARQHTNAATAYASQNAVSTRHARRAAPALPRSAAFRPEKQGTGPARSRVAPASSQSDAARIRDAGVGARCLG
jgi:hypothetical protein